MSKHCMVVLGRVYPNACPGRIPRYVTYLCIVYVWGWHSIPYPSVGKLEYHPSYPTRLRGRPRVQYPRAGRVSGATYHTLYPIIGQLNQDVSHPTRPWGTSGITFHNIPGYGCTLPSTTLNDCSTRKKPDEAKERPKTFSRDRNEGKHRGREGRRREKSREKKKLLCVTFRSV